MNTLTITIKHELYNVLAVVPTDATLYPTVATTKLASVYMRKGLKGNIYVTSIDVSGKWREHFCQNLGAWSNEDIAKIQAQSIQL